MAQERILLKRDIVCEIMTIERFMHKIRVIFQIDRVEHLCYCGDLPLLLVR